MTAYTTNQEPSGLLKRATIKGYNGKKAKITIGTSTKQEEVDIPYSFSSYDGAAIGSLPEIGTEILVCQTNEGIQSWGFVSFLNRAASLPTFNKEELILQSNANTKITLDKKNNIYLGSRENKIHVQLDYQNQKSLLSSNFEDHYSFTKASRNIDGLVRRSVNPGEKSPPNLNNDNNDFCKSIGLFPKKNTNITSGYKSKNPPFTEKREEIYEFHYDANVLSDDQEALLYGNESVKPLDYNINDRRKFRTDTLSLTLEHPNYLMETVKGTVVDICGNILDLNRWVIPVDKINEPDKTKAFLSAKELERKSIAYHFELNARKDLYSGQSKDGKPPDINSSDDYARNRSRFFIDIDKEGQFKINVPCSSEKGNIPLLVRYENFSNFYSEDPDKKSEFIYSKDDQDIFLDTFTSPFLNGYKENYEKDSNNIGGIEIIGVDEKQDGPYDRLTSKGEVKNYIKYGTAHHDILSTCCSLTQEERISYQSPFFGDPAYNIDVPSITKSNIEEYKLDQVVSKTIYTSGDKANAGGRSGSLNLDGSLDLNIGANTIDKQSLWLDTAGAIVANIGKDRNHKSLAMNLDGHVFIQVGNSVIPEKRDSRFEDVQTIIASVVDIRVANAGTGENQSNLDTMIRIDRDGMKILVSGNLQIHSSKDIKFTSDAKINIDCEKLTLQGRVVNKQYDGPSI